MCLIDSGTGGAFVGDAVGITLPGSHLVRPTVPPPDIDPALMTGRQACERLMAHGVLAKDTHGTTIRLAPPLMISEEDLDWALDQVEDVVRRP